MHESALLSHRRVKSRFLRLWQHWIRASAWFRLGKSGGIQALTTMQAGLARAAGYRAWDAWSLDQTAILWVAELVSKGAVHRVVEFGAGFSTLALSEFSRAPESLLQLDSFEHQPGFACRIRKHLEPSCLTTVHCASLLQVNDDKFESLFELADPRASFAASGTPVPKDRYHETRLRNVFYQIDGPQWEPGSVDLVILDGPNGNGRSIAFPLMKQSMRLPGWLLIDDHLDYPFVEYMQRVFSGRILREVVGPRKCFILVQVEARK